MNARFGHALLLVLAASLTGCGSSSPFDIVPVSGKVTYQDGSLIQADRIVVTFVPQDVASKGRDAAASATGDVNVADGTFSGLTTESHNDGAIVGRHKVLVQALKTGPAGVGEPTAAVPAKYAKAATTPLEVEVTSGNRYFDLPIDKTP
jgi:hypothetical protein